MDHIRRVILGLGSNVGDRVKQINSAVDELRLDTDMHVLKVSPLYETEAMGAPNKSPDESPEKQDDFANGAVLVLTSLAASEILRRTLAIETKLGRVRAVKNEPRTIDIDLLWIEGETVAEDGLSVPHPRLAERSFALRPLVDLASDAKNEAGEDYASLALAQVDLKLFS